MAIRSDQQRMSRYNTGGTPTINGNNIGWWERAIFPTDPSDVPLTLGRKYAMRPDLVAFDMYGKSSLQWFILQYNTISDVNVEFVEGTTIMLPTSDRLFTSLLTGAVAQ
jgi:hypothetical protein